MAEMSPWLRVALGILATWRVTHLLAYEDGPGSILARVRGRLGNGIFGKLMDCFACLSLWVALPISFWLANKLLDLVVIWLALSGAACVLERIGQEPVLMQPITADNEGETNHGMLRQAKDHSEEDPESGANADSRPASS